MKIKESIKVLAVAVSLALTMNVAGQEPSQTSSVQPEANYVFRGRIDDSSIKSVGIFKMDDNTFLGRFEVVDGGYVFAGHVEEPTEICVVAESQNTIGRYVIEPGNITALNHFLAYGSNLNNTFTSLVDTLMTLGNMVRRQTMTMDEYSVRHKSLVNEVYDRHTNDIIGARIIEMCVESPSDKLSMYRRGGDVVKKSMTLVPYVASWEKADATSEGHMVVDFEVEYNGKVQKLSDYVGRGKYVLVDFWASWCGPCKAEIPNIINVYNKYKGDKFEVVGVAVWDKPADTKRAVESLQIPYPQILNSQKIATDAYSISGVPQIILFAPDGTIVKRDLRGASIEKVVKQLLDEQ